MSAMDAFWAAPPVTRTLTAGAVILSLTVWSGIIGPYYVVFLPYKILKLELWRLVTPFLLTGPKLSILLDPYFLYTYGKGIEAESARFSQPGDFFVFIVFVCAIITLTAGCCLNAMMLLQPLTVALAYIYAQDNANLRMTFYIVTFRAIYLPYAMILMTFVMGSPVEALTQSTGLLAGHLYHFLSKLWPEYGGGSNLLQTPAVVSGWFAAVGRQPQVRGHGTAFQARPAGATGQQPADNVGGRAGGWTSGFNSAWNGRGAGRRLGGE